MAGDTIDRLPTSLSVRAHAFAVCEIERGHRIGFDPTEAATIHVVLAGRGTIRSSDGSEAIYGRGCVIVVPARLAHSLGGADVAAETTTTAAACGLLAEGLVRFTAGDGARDTLVACATVTATYGGALGLSDSLVSPLVGDLAADETIEGVFAALAREIAAPRAGTQALVEALMKQAPILLLRDHLLRLSVASPLFSSLHDERLARALSAVIGRPAGRWTVEALAARAGMSRSTFAERFARAFGHTPMDLVQIVRLRRGADLLRDTDLAVPVIAASVGFRGRTHVSRSFRTAYGNTPASHRAGTRIGEAIAFGASAGPSPRAGAATPATVRRP